MSIKTIRNCPSLVALSGCSTKLQEMIARCRKCGFCDQQPLCQDESPTKPVATGKKTEKARGVIHLLCCWIVSVLVTSGNRLYCPEIKIKISIQFQWWKIKNFLLFPCIRNSKFQKTALRVLYRHPRIQCFPCADWLICYAIGVSRC